MKFRQSDRDRNRGKTIRLLFEGKGEEGNDEKCWEENEREGWDTDTLRSGRSRVWDNSLIISHVFFIVDRITLGTTH